MADTGAGVVHLVDDDPGVRDALAFLLRSRGLVVRAFDGGPALLAALDMEGPPKGVFLLDVRMEPMSGTRLHDELLARRLKNPVLFLTGHGDIPMVVEALKKGAFDFLEKPYSDNALADRIEQALAVDAAMQAEGAQAAERSARLASLTEREREVMTRVAAGKLNKVIADELNVSVRTVEVHRARVFAKLGVRSAAEVATLLAGR
ncbi:response regulator transcription factor [Roseateles saccharophilus]|uniref:LuxR family two component transcriptional regulator n=1 Tax=Roseateles saccharophilus TaxID=304 RepID=A0A4R3VC79_ROSSA|nr:response regulator [Roseateles saccharophilus]MDG0831755.1 response regulator transcription factor [Roseateles saccharophilus]TCV01224.1 LuxR family two component transcriptional regulator [Roseateles saccharophilus]